MHSSCSQFCFISSQPPPLADCRCAQCQHVARPLHEKCLNFYNFKYQVSKRPFCSPRGDCGRSYKRMTLIASGCG